MQLLVRNRVKDFKTWHDIFIADTERGTAYGMTLVRIWQAADDPNNVFFLMDMESIEKCNAFMAQPKSQDAGEKAGVIDGEFWYLEAYEG